MNIKEKLQALQVLDSFLSDEDENFDKNDSQLPTYNAQTSGNLVFKRFKTLSPIWWTIIRSSNFKRFLTHFLKKFKNKQKIN